jgi:hypothetical protein
MVLFVEAMGDEVGAKDWLFVLVVCVGKLGSSRMFWSNKEPGLMGLC